MSQLMGIKAAVVICIGKEHSPFTPPFSNVCTGLQSCNTRMVGKEGSTNRND